MALVACHECRKDVSTQAASCPHCGAPVSGSGASVVTTQQTAKSLKLHMVVSGLMIVVGVIAMIATNGPHTSPALWAALLVVFGGVWLIVTKIRRWWNHG